MQVIGIYLKSFIGFLSVVLLLGLVLGSCDNGNKEIQQAIKKEVIGIHDEIMPKMREIVELKEQLKQIQNDFADQSGNSESMEKVTKLRQLQTDLNESESAMRTWMQEFKIELPEETPHEEIVEYYQTEKEEISAVRARMLAGIDAAKTFLSDNNE